MDTAYDEVVIFDGKGNWVEELAFDFGRFNFPDEKRKELSFFPLKYKYLSENNRVENIFSFLPLKKTI